MEGTGVASRTDAAGRFLLAGAPAGHQIVIVNGDSSVRGKRYGMYEIGVDVIDGQTTPLEGTVWLTALDPRGWHRIGLSASQETRITSSQIPGLEVRLPAGTEIHDASGRRVDRLNITAIPVDRPPSPLPGFQTVPLYFTIQPGRAYLSKGAQIIYPNWAGLPAGQRVAFWNYDAHDRGWYIYGHGSVSPDARQIVPDPGVRVWEFSGAMITGTPIPPSSGPTPGGGEPGKGGDPVDLGTGLFTYHKTDMVIPDVLPIVIDRTYRQGDSNYYSFGRGQKCMYDIALWSTNNYHEADLVLPDGGRVHYERISSGTTYTDAVYRSTSNAGTFYGSTIAWDGARPGWDLKLTSGLVFVFGNEAPLQAIRDQFGNELKIIRTSGQTGAIKKIVSPHGSWVRFNYEGGLNEIVDNSGRRLKYKYNGSNLLTSATDAEGRVTEYEYNGSGDMTSITDG